MRFPSAISRALSELSLTDRYSKTAEILATEPMAFMLCLWTAILLGILYLFFSAFNIVFGKEGYGL